MKKLLYPIFGLACIFGWSQEAKTIDTVYLFDRPLNRIKIFRPSEKLSAADIQKNSSNLAEALRFQSGVYIKENGRGMTASPAFRGTTASQTAFIWNGININSLFLGQGDINNIGLLGYDSVDVIPGGSSVNYGSAAIGGTVHLNNHIDFNKETKAAIYSEIGSFDTYSNSVKLSHSDSNLSVQINAAHTISQNDYEVSEKSYVNHNGRYYNTGFGIGLGYRFSPVHSIFWQSQFLDNSQHYPIFSEYQTPTKYDSQNLRSLLSWEMRTERFRNSFKAAFTEENFQYFARITRPKSSGGAGKNSILKNEFEWSIDERFRVDLIGEFQHQEGEGYGSGIDKVQRNTGSAAALLRYDDQRRWNLEAGIKKEFVEGVDAPWLYSFSAKYRATEFYTTGFNLSRNFRYPTFNDLYWQPGGNRELRPETSLQIDMNHRFRFGSVDFSINPYYTDIKDIIVWVPTPHGFWAPMNVNRVKAYGVDAQLRHEAGFGAHKLSTKLGYSLSKSVNQATKKQMMYVPLHKLYGNLDYGYKFLSVYLQGMFNGLTYADTDENRKAAIEPYFVMNAGAAVKLRDRYNVGVRVKNIFDRVYETTAYYPLPKRHYNFYIQINF
ncbi:MAG: TonB-dependent receptor [Chryseobacterium sp.]|nr:MAG: TonB-dependent receptor [Chryseobacterium sp.]